MDFFWIFSGRYDTSGSMIRLSVSEIEGEYPERDREEEGLVQQFFEVRISRNCMGSKFQSSNFSFRAFGTLYELVSQHWKWKDVTRMSEGYQQDVRRMPVRYQ